MHWQIFFSCPIRIWKVYIFFSYFLSSNSYLFHHLMYVYRLINFRKSEKDVCFLFRNVLKAKQMSLALPISNCRITHPDCSFLRRFKNIPTLFLGGSKLIKNKFAVLCYTALHACSNTRRGGNPRLETLNWIKCRIRYHSKPFLICCHIRRKKMH